MDSNNKNLEIVMGDDTDLNISEVGDMTNTLKPRNYEKKENIIIPVAKKKEQDKKDEDDENNEEK